MDRAGTPTETLGHLRDRQEVFGPEKLALGPPQNRRKWLRERYRCSSVSPGCLASLFGRTPAGRAGPVAIAGDGDRVGVVGELVEAALARSTAIITNRAFKDWTKVFPDALNAQVIAERLTARAERFVRGSQEVGEIARGDAGGVTGCSCGTSRHPGTRAGRGGRVP